ncbi:MAG: AbrB/MazE/SpoVT family DNA-binding domain-containing protein [Candidatus Paceibacterota bacterium]|jgi:antitoxin component of MazEF toxin-antitoxin module
MTTKLREWGNSYALGLPKAALGKLNLKPGDELTLEIRNGAYVYKPVKKGPRIPTLDEMIASIPEGGIKNEWEDVIDVGREIVEWNEKILPKKRRRRLG